jgi:hypothetical protein
LEAREYAGIEQRIADAEQVLRNKRAELENPAIASDGPKPVAAQAEREAEERDLDVLCLRWADWRLDGITSGLPVILPESKAKGRDRFLLADLRVDK